MSATPIPVAVEHCPDCLVDAGQEHGLSCPQVSLEAFRAFLGLNADTNPVEENPR